MRKEGRVSEEGREGGWEGGRGRGTEKERVGGMERKRDRESEGTRKGDDRRHGERGMGDGDKKGEEGGEARWQTGVRKGEGLLAHIFRGRFSHFHPYITSLPRHRASGTSSVHKGTSGSETFHQYL